MSRRPLASCLVFVFLSASVVHGAAQKIWTGAVNNAWSDAGNWTGGPPASTDIAIFPVSASNKSMNNDLNVTLTSIAFQGGSYTVGGNDVTVFGGITSASGLGSTPNRFTARVKALGTQPFTSSSGLLVFDGGVELSSGVNLVFDGAATTQVFQPITGPGTITKNGAGQTLFAAANTYTGITSINAGVINMTNASGLGAPGAGTFVNSGGTLHTLNIGTLAEPLLISGLGYDGSGGPLYVDEPTTLAMTANMDISGTTRIRGNITFSGRIGGTGLIQFVGGTIVLANGTNNFNADITFVQQGATLRLGADNAIPATSKIVSLEGASVLDLNNFVTTIAGVTGNGGGKILLGSGILTIASSLQYEFIGSITGSGGVNKRDTAQGSGAQWLYQDNPPDGELHWTGQTDVYGDNSGCCSYLGISAGQIGNVVIHNGGVFTISSDATAGNIVSIGGAVEPGIPGGRHGICNSLMLDAASQYIQVVFQPVPNGFGVLTVNNTVTLGDASLYVFPSLNQYPAVPMVILDNAGASPINGTFKDWPNGGVRTSNGKAYRVRYDDGDGNDIGLTQLAVRGDTNADTKSDVVWRKSTTGQTAMWLMDGVTVAAAGMPTVSDTNWKMAGLGDFNGDGKSDILWWHSVTGQVVIWFMNGTSVTSAEMSGSVPDTNWKIAGAGDVNADQKSDILWRNQSTGQVVVWMMNGSTNQGANTVGTVPDLNWTIVGLGDFNADGKQDLLWRNGVTGQNVIWFMNGNALGTATFTNTVVNLDYKVVGVSDSNADGRADVFWWNQATGEVVVWGMDGATVATGGLIGTVSDLNYHVEAVGDFDSDAKADLLWRKTNSGAVVVWLLDGSTLRQATLVTTVSDLNWSAVGPH